MNSLYILGIHLYYLHGYLYHSSKFKLLSKCEGLGTQQS